MIRRLIRIASLVGFVLTFTPGAGCAQQRTPELIPGKKTLYQRVLTRTGAVLYHSLSPKRPAVGAPLPPMSPYYVYGATIIDGREWLELGASQNRAEGWVDASQTMIWNRTLTASIPPLSGSRQRVLFFRNGDELARRLAAPNAAQEMESLLRAADHGALPPDSPVLAWEPPEPPSAPSQFFVQPILEVRDVDIGPRSQMRMLRVASESIAGGMPLLGPNTPTPMVLHAPTKTENLKQFRAGVVFVLDTSKSMQPYIDSVHQVMSEVYGKLTDSKYGKNLGFGLVAFQSDVQRVPRLDYNTRIFTQLRAPDRGQAFLKILSEVRATSVSSDSFDEDSFAGLKAAIEDIKWEGYNGRFIILVTDAGSKQGTASSTNLYADGIRGLAQTNKTDPIAIVTLHLLTPEGARAKNHRHAREQYIEVSRIEKSGENAYFGVSNGSLEEFSKIAHEAANEIIRQIERAYSDASLPPETNTSDIKDLSPENRTVTVLRSRLASLGRTMQLRYLGQVGERQEPRIIDAWMADRSVGQPRPTAMRVNILITKQQLSQVADALREIIRKGEETRGRSRDFFAQLRSISALLSFGQQAPDAIRIERLVEFGGLNELLAGLPYNSRLTEMTEEHWISMPPAEQRMLLDQLEGRIELYGKYNSDSSRWQNLDNSHDVSNYVMQIPLDELP